MFRTAERESFACLVLCSRLVVSTVVSSCVGFVYYGSRSMEYFLILGDLIRT